MSLIRVGSEYMSLECYADNCDECEERDCEDACHSAGAFDDWWDDE